MTKKNKTEQPQTDVTTLTLSDLKALAYDEIEKKENAQQNLNVINSEIIKRRNAVKPPTETN